MPTGRKKQENKGKAPGFTAGSSTYPKVPPTTTTAMPKTTEPAPPKMGQFTAPSAPKPSKSAGWEADPVKDTW